MAFYEDISKYYDDIFPVSNYTLEFLKSSIGEPPKTVLDVACGTGGYSLELDKLGYDVTAIDLDSKMIESLSEKANISKTKVKFLQSNMLELNKKFNEDMFEAVYCIGNSLVHLNDVDEIKKFFTDVRRILGNDGTFVFQIINYNRIISNNVKGLPTIVRESVPLKFERAYEYEKSKNKVIFKTSLSVEDNTIKNAIELMPLMYDDAVSLLKEAGFTSINAYGDFKRSNFDKNNSYALVIQAK